MKFKERMGYYLRHVKRSKTFHEVQKVITNAKTQEIKT